MPWKPDFNLRFTKKHRIQWLGLGFLSLVYRSLLNLRNIGYTLGFIKSYKAESAVISIGNITVGGTGKTPMVSWMIDFCQRNRLNPAVLTRGYKAERENEVEILNQETSQHKGQNIFGDEPWLLFKKHPHVPFYISPNRKVAAKLASDQVDLLLLDDGMQHIKLQRDLEIVLIDATVGIGNGRLLPLGPLRESLTSLRRADVVIYTKTNLKCSEEIREKLSPYLSHHIQQFDGQFVPTLLIPSKNNSPCHVEKIQGKRCLLFSGIGNPSAFEGIIKKSGGIIANHLVMEDHHLYNQVTFENLCRFVSENKHEFLLCTEKDWVKLEKFVVDLPLFYYLKMDMIIEKAFEDWLVPKLTEIVQK